MEPQTLESAVREWTRQQSEQVQPQQEDRDAQTDANDEANGSPALLPGVSIDGKDVRGASRQAAAGRRMLVAAVEQGSGMVLGQLKVPSKTNEIPVFRELVKQLDIAGRVVTGEALHAQQETARRLLEECGADYLVTAVNNNQETILRDLQEMNFSACLLVETVDKQHGRIERRRYWVKDISAPEWDDYAALRGRQQAIRVERRREGVKTGQTSCEVSYALT